MNNIIDFKQKIEEKTTEFYNTALMICNSNYGVLALLELAEGGICFVKSRDKSKILDDRGFIKQHPIFDASLIMTAENEVENELISFIYEHYDLNNGKMCISHLCDLNTELDNEHY
jgi:hypothetical protein